jgi:hypothetical protein
MPLVYLKCSKCEDRTRRIFKKIPDYSNLGNCNKCASPLEREATGATSQIVEFLDNGVMRKSVTRLARAEELIKDREKADPQTKKTQFV